MTIPDDHSGRSPQHALVDDEQDQRDGEHAGRQPDRVHAPGPAGEGADEGSPGEGQDQRAVDREARRDGMCFSTKPS